MGTLTSDLNELIKKYDRKIERLEEHLAAIVILCDMVPNETDPETALRAIRNVATLHKNTNLHAAF